MLSSPARRIAAEERIFSLILALVASPFGLTKHDLLSSVYGYSVDYERAPDSAAIHRKFERDKEQLRLMGIPLETSEPPTEPGNNQETRYRISQHQLELPSSVRFSDEELILLRAAALAWSEGSLSEASRRAVMKLSALGAVVDERQLGVAPQLTIAEPAAHPLRLAIEAGRVVTFSYRKPSDEAAEIRTVAPLQLHRADGRWHLLAFDHYRGDYRVFLLSRITGRVTQLAETVDRSHFEILHALTDELEDRQYEQVATLSVREGSIASSRLGARAVDIKSRSGRTQMQLHTLDYVEFADELIGYGADVTVLDPPELISAVRSALSTIYAQHSVTSEADANEYHAR